MPRPSPHELHAQAGGDPARYRELMVEHGHLVPGKPEPLPCGWTPGTATPGLTPADEMRALLDRLPPAPWMVDDCEGELQVWPESELRDVTRDENGQTTGYRTPSSLSMLLAEWPDLDTWDPGEDERDDRWRDVADFLVAARNMLPGLLAGHCSCDGDPIECTHEAARGQAEEEARRNRQVVETLRHVLDCGELPSAWNRRWRDRAETAEAEVKQLRNQLSNRVAAALAAARHLEAGRDGDALKLLKVAGCACSEFGVCPAHQEVVGRG